MLPARGRFTPVLCSSVLALSLSACGNDGHAVVIPGTPASPPGKSVPGHEKENGANTIELAKVFGTGRTLEYHLTLSEEDQVELEEHGNREEYLSADLVVRGHPDGDFELGEVGFRHKGAYTLHHCWDHFGGVRSYEDECAKLSYKIKFHEFEKDTRFFGLKKLNLHASSADQSKMRELLAYDMFNSFEVDAPRATPARVYINGTFAGLFIAIEAIDGRFTAERNPQSGDGNLYKETWPASDQEDEYFISALRTNDDPEEPSEKWPAGKPDVSDMQAFSRAVESTSSATFAADMDAFVDIEHTLRYMAIDRASKNWDGVFAFYSEITPHNFYWYKDDVPDSRFRLIPWDMDTTFWANDPYLDPPSHGLSSSPVPNWNVKPAACLPIGVWGGSSTIYAPGCNKFHQLLASTQWSNFVRTSEELLAGPLSLDVIMPKLDAWFEQLDPIVQDDPLINHADWLQEVQYLRGDLAGIRADFESFLAEGYIMEEPPEPLPEPTEDELMESRAESGIIVSKVHNFEFDGGISAETPADTWSIDSSTSTSSIVFNTIDPYAGNADLLFNFEFTRTPGAWNEWVNLGVGTDGGAAFDIREYSQISMVLSSDRSRTVRIRLDSPTYQTVFGGIDTQFGIEVSVNETPTLIRIPYSSLSYPNWANGNAVFDSQGLSISQALQSILEQFSGFIFDPAPTRDGAGEMLQSTEAGYIKIDNIYFQ